MNYIEKSYTVHFRKKIEMTNLTFLFKLKSFGKNVKFMCPYR